MKNLITLLITSFFIGSCVMTRPLEKSQSAALITQDNVRSKVEREKELEMIKSERKKDEPIFAMGRYDDNGELLMQLEADEVKVTGRLRNLAERNGEVALKFKISIPKKLQDKYYNIIITPELYIETKESEPMYIEPLVVCGDDYSVIRDRQYFFADKYRKQYEMRQLLNGKNDSMITKLVITTFKGKSMLLDTVLSKGDNIVYSYTHLYKVQDDIKKIYATLTGRVASIDRSSYKLPPMDTIQYNISSLNKFMDTRDRFIEKIVSKYAKVEDKRFIVFGEGKSEIVDTLNNNKEELRKIYNLIDSMFLQEEFIIDSIKLTASSSPEGYQQLNERLSKERAMSLAKFIENEVGKDKVKNLIKPTWIGENWSELVHLISSDTTIHDRSDIVSDIKSAEQRGKLDDYENVTMRKRDSYKHIRAALYPQLRSVTFTYNLRRKNMIQDTVKTNEIDQTYKRAIGLLKKRQYGEAVELFAFYNDQNYALCLLNLGRNKNAYNVLKVLPKSEDVNYLLTIVCCRLELLEEAKGYFEMALISDPYLKYRAGLDPELKPLLDIMPSLFEESNNNENNTL